MLQALTQPYPEAFYRSLRAHAPMALRAATVLGAVAMGSFAAVDASFISGDSLRLSLWIRAASVLLLTGLLGLTFRPGWAPRHARSASIAACWITGLGVIAVTYMVGGAASRYHEALYLALFGYAILPVPWRPWDAAVVFGGLVLSYDATMLIGHKTDSTAIWIVNNALLWLGWLIAVVLQRLIMRGRYNDYRNREELGEANTRLQTLDRAKSRFFANLSHELRTPLTLILAPVEALAQEARRAGDNKQAQQLGLVRRNALRLLRLVDDLLALTRAEAASLKLRISSVHLRTLVTQLEREVGGLTARKQLGFEVHIDDDTPAIRADAQLVERVLLNLISNAAKFTPQGGLLSIRVQTTREGGVEVAVTDTGKGIPEDALEHIFQRFYQVDDGKTRSFGGTGIGLALAREIVELHGGWIRAESVFGEGTTMRFMLPAAPPDSAPTEEMEGDAYQDTRAADTRTGEAKPAAEGQTGLPEWHAQIRGDMAYRLQGIDDATERRVAPRAPIMGRAPTLLIVEDNPDMVRFLVALLAGDFNTITAQDGVIGLALAQKRQPDLVISDVMMPRMDGFEMVRRLRADDNTRRIPVIFLTAKGRERDRVEGRHQGADVFLAKPFKVEELVAAIRSLLDRQRSVRAAADEGRDEALVFMATGLVDALSGPLQRLAILAEDRAGQAELGDAVAALDKATAELQRFAEAGVADPIQEIAVADAIDTALGELDVSKPAASKPAGSTLDATAKVSVSCPPELRVRFPEGHLPGVLATLVRRALRHSPDGERPSITVQADADGRVTISVHDEGPTVPNQHLDRLFYPYYAPEGGPDCGLALAGSRRLVEQAGGLLFVDSGDLTGATFIIRLPLSGGTPHEVAT